MSSLDSVPVNVETSFISINLNSTLLSVFLGGMYTIIYSGTIYVYYTKNSSKYHLVPTAITLLYLNIITSISVQWYLTKWEFVDNGATRESVFTAAYINPPWVVLITMILAEISFSIADGLLIWRCFHVWNHSWRILLVPLVLMGAEIVLYLVSISFAVKYRNGESVAVATILNDILAAASFISFGTTLVTTALIAYRIYSISNQEGSSSRRFKHIIDIVAQSGAVYALSQFLTAMSVVVPAFKFISNAGGYAFEIYVQDSSFPIAGIASMVMVARVALLADDATYPSTSVHISGLQFHAHSTHPAANIEEIAPSIDGGRIPDGEGQIVEEKTLSNIA